MHKQQQKKGEKIFCSKSEQTKKTELKKKRFHRKVSHIINLRSTLFTAFCRPKAHYICHIVSSQHYICVYNGAI